MTAYEVAKTQLGIKEPSKKISEYHATTLDFSKANYHTAWCSSFVNWCYDKAGIIGTESAWARSWLKWGMKLSKPVEGCVVVFSRGSNKTFGHVGFFVSFAMAGTMVRVLGGNQGDEVCYKLYPRWRVLSYRGQA